MAEVTSSRKLAAAIVLFAVAIGIVAISAATKVAGPLFAAWLPLVLLAWILGQPGPGERRSGTEETVPPGTRTDEGNPPSDVEPPSEA